MMNKCTSCGAPIEDSDEKCQYCGTITPYGEKIAKIREQKKQELERRKREEERAREMNAMPAMKYIPGVLIALFYAVTLGLYSPYWYITRMKNLNSLKSKAKIPAWVVNLFAVLCVYMLVALPHYRADSFLDSQIEKLKEKHRREGRILYIPQNKQEENIDFGTRLSAFGIGMASALNGGIFEGFGRQKFFFSSVCEGCRNICAGLQGRNVLLAHTFGMPCYAYKEYAPRTFSLMRNQSKH